MIQKAQHTAVYIHAEMDRKWLIEELLQGGVVQGFPRTNDEAIEVFSNITLQFFIKEELIHDRVQVATGFNTSLANASSGEQRKALINFILSRQPAAIILDDVYESLDVQTRQWMLDTLSAIEDSVLLVQVFSRNADLLPFIDTIYLMENNEVDRIVDRQVFQTTNSRTLPADNLARIPAPLHKFDVGEEALVRMNEVSVGYNERPVLDRICWEIKPGEFWQLKGTNGSGKTTLLTMITGDNPKAFGQDIYLFGRLKGSGETVWEIKEKVGYFNPNMIRDFERHDSVEQMIISGFFDSVGLYIKPTEMQINLAWEWLSVLGLTSQRRQAFRLFPPGLQRMILIARAMVKHPPLLILDEPTSGLDDESAILFTALVNKIAAESTTAIVYVSHRTEAGLQPQKIFQLMPGAQGSTGSVTQ
ncbi:MAG: ATP-binding cassette domain-containing protein [Ferruginibacter sp.]|nr:ATP-binding cassette domain-containing protein [Ferruginibacter sp.]